MLALREIGILKKLNHPNIIKLVEIVHSSPSLSRPDRKDNDINRAKRGYTYLVLEYMAHSLSGILYAKEVKLLTIPQIKCISRQILEGLHYLQRNGIVHRDIKSQNILISKDGDVKISDFGLAKSLHGTKWKEHTNRVVTLWYRAPELLLGETAYSHAIDMWSFGCLLAELYMKRPLFREETEKEMVKRIVETCVSTEGQLESMKILPLYQDHVVFPPLPPPPGKSLLSLSEHIRKSRPDIDDFGLQLIQDCLALNPSKRITAVGALEHPYFGAFPAPTPSSRWLSELELKFEYHDEVRLRTENEAWTKPWNKPPPQTATSASSKIVEESKEFPKKKTTHRSKPSRPKEAELKYEKVTLEGLRDKDRISRQDKVDTAGIVEDLQKKKQKLD
jgi:serine/threonine protein kinase